MQFGIADLGENSPNPVTGTAVPAAERLEQLIDLAVFVEELGFDAFGIGERHSKTFLSSSTAVLLGIVADRTERIRLLPTVAVLPTTDPVRVAEDYATLDLLSGSRVDLVIGKGNDRYQMELFGLTQENQWQRLRESYEIVRDLLGGTAVSREISTRPALNNALSYPRPQKPLTIWHGSASSRDSALLAAANGDPLFSANALHGRHVYAELINVYRDAWVQAGHGERPEQATVAAGAGFFHVAKTSQEAREQARPYFEGYLDQGLRALDNLDFHTLEEWIDRGPALIGSPAEIADKVLANHEAYGHVLQFFDLHNMKIPEALVRQSLELFAADAAPQIAAAAPGHAWQPAGATSGIEGGAASTPAPAAASSKHPVSA
jgi:alkanesulfonate monooxygenase SsuD/methylene tetrahydromethanopterin reductase-like flavin-dependent oxidoreductase (luciferase family)